MQFDITHGPPRSPAAAASVDAAVTELFLYHRLALVRLAFLLVGDQETAEDVVQDAFAGSRFLLSKPLRPAVRATVLRLLADLPTTAVRGVVRDPLSREGLAVDFGEGKRYFREFGEDDEVIEDHTTVLDPATGEILAEVTKAGEDAVGLSEGQTVDSQTWTPTTGWTDDRPERPRNCRRL
ncbi:hypothetical protein ACFYUV_34465 [Nonomuraea sp. NPDC003560]|uniref:hypothetical protein n=1 Tax=Nonomuraea sp. NPDC003560 TaxID=3364341 RepID=UPI0036D1B373